MNRLQIGDTIKFHDPEDMVNVDQRLIKEGYETEYEFFKGGVKGLWIVITGYSETP